MSKEGQKYKTITISNIDFVNYAKKMGLNISPQDANKFLSKIHKEHDPDRNFEEYKREIRAKVTEKYGIENDPIISDEEMTKKVASKITKK